MTHEPMPEVPARERDFPDGSRGMLTHINFGPLPDDPAERAIERARRAALRAEMSANRTLMKREADERDRYFRSLEGRWSGLFDFMERRIGYRFRSWRREHRLSLHRQKVSSGGGA